MTQPTIRVFDIENQLAGDVDGDLKRKLCEELAEELRVVKQEMNAGLAPEDFQRTEKYASALERASSVVQKIWDAEH